MVRLFVQVVGEGDSGIVVKLEGHASLNQQTGQLTATFDNNPQLPFSDLKLTLAGGSRATLANPRVCGPVGTSLDMTPWSNPFTTDVSAISTFEINQGCISPQFNPSFVAGTTNIQAGEYTPFTLSFGRSDADEFLNGLQMQMPPGLLGSLTGIPLCKEPRPRRHMLGGEPDRSYPGIDRSWSDAVPGDRGPGVLDRRLQGRPVWPVDRGAGKGWSVHAVWYYGHGQRGGAGGDQHRSSHRGVDGHLRSVADGARRDPIAVEGRERHDRSPGVHIQSDELRQNRDHRDALEQGKRWSARIEPVPGHQLCRTRLQAAVQGLDLREDLQSQRCEPRRQGHLPRRGEVREHRQGQGRPAQAATLALDDSAEGLSCGYVQREPSELARRTRWSGSRGRTRRSCQCS